MTSPSSDTRTFTTSPKPHLRGERLGNANTARVADAGEFESDGSLLYNYIV
jgi:hypothetical protein